MKIKSILMLFPFAVFQVNAGPDVREGMWKITSQVLMSGMPIEIPSMTRTECINKQSLDPEVLLKDYNCQFNQTSARSNFYSWTMSCDQQGIKMNGTGELTYQNTSFNGNFDMEMSGGAGPIKMSTSITGEYIGACSN